MMPANEELWRALLRLEAQVSDQDTLRSVADEAYAAIERFGSPLGASAQTDALVDELLPGHRSRVA
jgi:hypothetical protein